MVRNLGEFPNFVVFNSRIESFGNSSVFTFSLLLFALYIFLCLLFECDQLGVSNIFMTVFSDEHKRLPTSPSLGMGGCVLRASITRGPHECYMMRSSTSGTTGMFQYTILMCPWLIAWSSVRSA
jgi:hypothetical protein